ncbi:MAG: hypothetical protein ACRERD_08055, partial [Candidatus Binatia bacterium]
MAMTASLRKFTLTAHVTSSVGWLGALAVFLAHAIVSYTSQDEQLVRAACLAMGVAAWFVILPLSLTSFVTGLIQALGTAWGLFRHYWVLFKLLLTSIATAVLLLKLAPISVLADAAAKTAFSSASLAELRASILVHAAGGLVVLLTITALALYKPQGLTPYGAKKQLEGGAASVAITPKWV